MSRRHERQPEFDLPDLSGPGVAPDLTGSIMSRLGYERCGPEEARRRRRLRTLRRSSLVLVVGLVAGLGINFYRVHRAVRVPSGPTIPSALEHDVQLQHRILNATFGTFQRLKPPAQSPPRNEVDPKAMAPVRWI